MQASHGSSDPLARRRGSETHRAMPDDLDQFGGICRRSAGELGADTAARGTDDLRALDRGAYDEYGLTDNSHLRR
jgi:hypothetical protein